MNPIRILLFSTLVISSCHSNLETVEVKDNSGKVSEQYHRDKKNGKKEGQYIQYYPSGKKFEESFYANDQLQGVRTLYYENGKVQVIEHYNQGQFEGDYQSFYENGQLKVQYKYKRNVIEGKLMGYYDNGQLKEIVSFKDNEENGPFIEYHPNGKLKAEGNYINGDHEDGLLKLYNESGELYRQMQCDHGNCHTIWTNEKQSPTKM